MNEGLRRKWFRAGLTPHKRISVSEWADRHRILSSRASAEPGYWRTSRTPYLKEIMDCLSVTSPVEKIVLMKGSQTGGTECGNNWIGYIIDHAPAPTILVQPTVEMAKRNSKQRIAPLIEECPRLLEKVKDSRSRDSGNTVLAKEFPGGILVMTGANSAVGLRSLPAKFAFLDEVDGYPLDADGEGDPIALVEARARTFARRKLFYCSTPTIEHRSRIERYYELSDKRRYHVPCPRCGAMQVLKWPQLKWEKGEEQNAWYVCEHCQGKIENWEKTKMLEAGEWIADRPGHAHGKIAGFHLSSLYSPVGWFSWGDLAQDWRDSQGSVERLRSFVNTVLGETWKDKGEAPEWEKLYARREPYELNSIPNGVLFLTCGVDIQRDRIELEIVGWGRNKRSWSIDYRILYGDTAVHNAEVWQELSAILGSVWKSKDGIELPIRLACIDSGHATQTVYSFCRQYPINKVLAIKGQETLASVVGHPRVVDVSVNKRKIRGGARVLPIGVNLLKSELYGWLRQNPPESGHSEPVGFCHFPEYSEEYFKQLTSEQMFSKVVNGYKKYYWEKIRDRNEALDCRIYARAAATVVGIDRFTEQSWASLELQLGVKNPEKDQKGFQMPVKKVKIKRRKSSFWD